jgi:AraC family L-rhamnose operon regulatory protein RhaS
MEGMADKQILLESGIPAFRYYEQYRMTLSIKGFDVAEARYSVRPEAWWFVLVLSGSVSFPSRLSSLRAPFIACLKRDECFETSAADLPPLGFAVSFEPAIINRSFADALPLDPQQITDPFVRRDAELAKPFMADTGLARELRADEADFMALLLRQIQSLTASQEDPYWPCRSRSYFLEALVLISEMGGNMAPAKNTKAHAIINYLHAHYAEKQSLDDIARFFGTNRTSLQKIFKDEFGMSVFEHVLYYRISMAQLLIRNTQLSLKEIGFRVGYGDYSQFFREFSKRCRMSPQEFRDGTARIRVY